MSIDVTTNLKSMIRNYFKIAFRNLVKTKVFSFINIIGLTVGITGFLLTALYIFDELTFDRFHKNASNIYRLVDNRTSDGGKQTKIAGAGYQVSEKGKKDLPEIKDVARLATFSRINVMATENNRVFYEDFTIGSPGLLTVFDFPLMQGDRNSALTLPQSAVVTEATARKLFGTTQVQGKTLQIGNDTLLYKISGVLRDFPVNSSISFNIIFSESSVTNDNFKKFISIVKERIISLQSKIEIFLL